jgi:hypothetical protein
VLSGTLAPTPLVIEIKDTNTVHDCGQIRALSLLDPVSLARVVTVANQRPYEPLVSAVETRCSAIAEGLKDCGESLPLISVDQNLTIAYGQFRDQRILEPAFRQGIPIGADSLEELDAELCRFDPDAADWEIASWAMTSLVAFAHRDTGPFTVAELAQDAAGLAWKLMSAHAQAGVTAAVRRILAEARQTHLQNYLIDLGGRFDFNAARIRGQRSREVRQDFVERAGRYASWKRSTQAAAEGLGL